jgi:hypothetical protein
MRRIFTVVLLTLLVAGLIATAGAAYGVGGNKGGGGFEIIAIPQPEHDVYYDWGWTFQDAIETTAGEPIDGWDGGQCVNLDADPEAIDKYTCNLVFHLPDGDITAAGPFDINEYSAGRSVFAVTGGTGAFRNIRGEVEVLPAADWSRARVVFRVMGAAAGY